MAGVGGEVLVSLLPSAGGICTSAVGGETGEG
jgi:hypothetical protein